MPLSDEDVSAAILEMRDLLRLLAEPAIAERDRQQRQQLKGIVGGSAAKSKAVRAMDGNCTQADICKLTGINQGQLSTLVKHLLQSGLIIGDAKRPAVSIVIPSDLFENS